MAAVFALADASRAANPYLPLWEFIPDGEPYVFDDPDAPGQKRVYVYGSHDNLRSKYCGRDQVVWSASVADLNTWRFDGVIFRSLADANGRALNKSGLGDVLYAPDVAEVVAPDGKKTYYLYPNTQAHGRGNMVAKSDRPDGPFEVCNWSDSDPARTVGPFGFDPAVLVDDDGRVYGYWGFRESYAAELDPKTMATVKPGTAIVTNMVSGLEQPGVFRFFEASSIRKIKDKYVFIYSRWTKDGEFGLPGTNYTLAYAYADAPLGPWTYGGTIIDGRSREKGPDGRTITTACPGGNTHGSICEINGRWWVFYHRQCGRDEFSRQAMVAPVTVEVEPGPGGRVAISEGEYTSEGFETDGLDPFEYHAAGIACHYTGPTPARQAYPRVSYSGPYMRPFYADCYDEKNPYDRKVNRCDAAHVTGGSTLGYKYFDFGKTSGRDGLKLVLDVVPTGAGGRVEAWVGKSAYASLEQIGEAAIPAGDGVKSVKVEMSVAALKSQKGKNGLYLKFGGEGGARPLCDIEGIRFEAAEPAKGQAFRNPVIWADVPDMALCSDGKSVYMVSTTMHLMPGAPVMKSDDMVHWKTVSYVFDEIADGPRYELAGGETVYGEGQWAASFRYHGGRFWVWFNCNGAPWKGFLYVADKAEGPWRLHSRPGGWHDSSLFFDDDGRVYMFHGTGRLTELSSDLSGAKSGGLDRQLFERDADERGLLEGSFAFKRDGWYYLMMISQVWGVPGRIRREVCYRSRSLTGEWEKKVILEAPFGSWGGLGQGQVVECPDGKWRALIFQDRGGVGRVPFLLDCFWTGGWPMLGDSRGKTIPSDESLPYPSSRGFCGSDDFGSRELSLLWQWNHRPAAAGWSLAARRGWLRLKPIATAANLMTARNTLTQRMTGPACSGEVKLDFSGLRDGDRAGIAAFQSDSGVLAVENSGGRLRLVMGEEKLVLKDGRRIDRVEWTEHASEQLRGKTVWLRVRADFRQGRDWAEFDWREPGGQWRRIGGRVALKFDYRRFFMGTKFALFCYSTKRTGGHADFDTFVFREEGHEEE